DPEGKIRTVGNGIDFTADKLRALMRGEEVKLYHKQRSPPVFDPITPSPALLYQSILTEWDGEKGESYSTIEDALTVTGGNHFRVAMMPLLLLYHYAYFGRYSYWLFRADSLFGKVYPTPVFETKDSSMF